MDIKKYTNANKLAWEQVMPKHQKSSKERLDNLFSTPGYTVQDDKDLLNIFSKVDLKDKDVIHLCCNNGIELLSIKNMGAARCVGIDISELAVKYAIERSSKFNIDCEFFVSDVFDLPKQYYNSFDVVHITAGCIGWMPDLKLFFEICNKVLRKGGSFIIHEIHPFSEILPFDSMDFENMLIINEPYFRNEPIIEQGTLDYVGNTTYEGVDEYWFVHTISDIVMALSNNSFTIEDFIESPKDISAGHSKIEKLEAEIPLSLIIHGLKK